MTGSRKQKNENALLGGHTLATRKVYVDKNAMVVDAIE